MHNANNSDFQIRSVQPEDATAVVAFLNRVYGNWGNIDHWRWKYLEPPAPFRYDSILAEHQGEIIGHYGLLPLEAIVDGKVIPIAQGIDAAVSPDYRRKGVYTAMAYEILCRAINDGVKFIFAIPGLYALDVNLNHGYQAVDFVSEWTCLINFPQALILTIRNFPKYFGGLWAYYQGRSLTSDQTKYLFHFYRSFFFIASFLTSPNLSWPGRLSPHMEKAIVHPISHFGDHYNDLWDKLSKNTQIGLCKHANYLNWRFFSSPSNHYHAYEMQIDKNLVGCFVLKNEGVRCEIAELLFLPEYPNAADSLLWTALSLARKNKKVSLHIWAKDKPPLKNNLRRAGFVSPSKLHKLANQWQGLANKLYQVIFYTDHLSPNQQMILSPKLKAWQPSKGDSDLL